MNWEKIRPEKTEVLDWAKNKADKQLAHLSLWRLKLERDGKKVWVYKPILQDIENVIKKFNEAKENK